MSKTNLKGFTIVELLIVVVVIAILAAISVVAYRGMQERAAVSVMSADLSNAARALELYKVDSGNYPAGLPDTVKASGGVVLSATNTTAGNFCINAYYQNSPSIKVSWDSSSGLQEDSLCSGATIGSSVGGSVPLAVRGTNIVPGFSQWTLTGTASYSPSLGEVTLGVNGSVRSPLIRVDAPVRNIPGGEMYAAVASNYASFTPQGGFHIATLYYASDGVTPVQNSAGNAGNGCAYAMPLSTWNTRTCSFFAGPNVVYMTVLFYGAQASFASPDIKIRNPSLIVND